MNNFETVLMIDKIKSQRHAKDLVKDMDTIKNWYYSNSSFSEISGPYTSIFNTYKCLTLAISLYIAKCSSPLSVKIYEIKHIIEQRLLSEEFLSNNNKVTYEWLIDTFQYAADIPADTPNSLYTQINSKQICVRHNMNYAILNKLALLVKDRIVPFTIDFNSNFSTYYEGLIPSTINSPQHIMKELVIIQTLKSRADNNIKYTLFERAINEKLEELSKFKYSPNFTDSIKKLSESIRSMEELDSKYLEIKAKRKHNE